MVDSNKGIDIQYPTDPIPFIGNRNMLAWMFRYTKIPHELIYSGTGFSKEQFDTWINDPKSPLTNDQMRDICNVVIIPISVFYLDDEHMPPDEDDNATDVTIIEGGMNFIISREEILGIKHLIDKTVESDDVDALKLGFHQVLRYLRSYIIESQY